MSLENHALNPSIVKLRAVVPEDAFTAGILGSERIGNGIVINSDGLILTIGYLITEATDVWLTANDGQELPGHALANDQVTGFGLVLPLKKPDIPPLQIGSSAKLHVGDNAGVASYTDMGKQQPVQIVARREFAGAWEYLLEEAIFTAPAHSHWSGAALLDDGGSLVGLGSLLVRETVAGEDTNANMFVPIDLLKPILDDLMTRGRAHRQSRPWLGVYAVEVSGRVYVTGVADGSPAQVADLREGDLISQVDDREVASLSDFYRRLWSLGPAGVGVPLTTVRGGTTLRVNLRSVDRTDLLKRPQAH
ncbi:MAG: S1C family serine protease [Pseudomonadota bacterium]|nr:S1C family serine protease [Pseudomonadota bacterium]